MRRRLPGLLCMVALPLAAWGDKGHQVTAGLALRSLPPGPKAWFEGREEAFRDAATAPDRWKAHDHKEGPRHFLDLEAYGGPEGLPHDVQAALAKVGAREFQKQGQLPWIIQDRFRDLVAAFQAGDARQVAETAGHLAHYVGDAHVPLHTTTNHDGQETGQRGVHARWESALVERYVSEQDLSVRPARVDLQVLERPFGWIEESHALVPQVLEQDKAADRTRTSTPRGFRRDTPAWMMAWALSGATVKLRLQQAGERLGDLILTAWERAGRPNPPRTSGG